MKIATWNVNGIRAREAQLVEWIDRERPDVLCLQEIKAGPDAVPLLLAALPGYWTRWHGEGGYSGVAMLVGHSLARDSVEFIHPAFDFERRAVAATVGGVTVLNVYVPNGGKDFAAKARFFDDLVRWTAAQSGPHRDVIVCGDLNIARADIDVHPKERKPSAIGQLPEEREWFARLLDAGLMDVARALHPEDEAFFTWWAPWRNLRQRNIGWRIDYLLASPSLAARASTCESQRLVGTSDHAPLVTTFAPAGDLIP
jgi:exodeoxyribonuclease III